ncbi:hypothetical protein AAFF_G00221230 [Aldrovandia affinis]|uniref:Uncharacterized protein n=1 Tax=Aldrovandia affinis TaxID=143900 RepID=A0AAD7RFM5_9TELE|nr:hypothetical protein AAFF_G00221230 [Aldrovandia affinis]
MINRRCCPSTRGNTEVKPNGSRRPNRLVTRRCAAFERTAGQVWACSRGVCLPSLQTQGPIVVAVVSANQQAASRKTANCKRAAAKTLCEDPAGLAELQCCALVNRLDHTVSGTVLPTPNIRLHGGPCVAPVHSITAFLGNPSPLETCSEDNGWNTMQAASIVHLVAIGFLQGRAVPRPQRILTRAVQTAPSVSLNNGWRDVGIDFKRTLAGDIDIDAHHRKQDALTLGKVARCSRVSRPGCDTLTGSSSP